jgi:hypothetical protein
MMSVYLYPPSTLTDAQTSPPCIKWQLVAELVIVSYKCEIVLSKFIEAQAWALLSCSLGLGVSDNQVCCLPPGVQSTEASGLTH